MATIIITRDLLFLRLFFHTGLSYWSNVFLNLRTSCWSAVHLFRFPIREQDSDTGIKELIINFKTFSSHKQSDALLFNGSEPFLYHFPQPGTKMTLNTSLNWACVLLVLANAITQFLNLFPTILSKAEMVSLFCHINFIFLVALLHC